MPNGGWRSLSIGLICVLTAAPAAVRASAWTPIGPGGGPVQSVTYDPVDPSVVYGVAGSQVIKSLDGGVSWFSIDPPGFGFTPEVLVDPLVPTTIYVTRTSRAYKSTDGGATWTWYPTNEVYPSSMAIDPVTPSHLWIGGAGKIHRSTDGAVTWTPVALPAPATTEQAFEIAVDPVNPSTLYAATSFGTAIGIYKSTDGGLSYTRVLAGVPAQAIAVDPLNPQRVFAGALGGPSVYRSADGGGSWTVSTTGLASGVTRHGLAVDPSNPQIVYAGGGGITGKLHKSTDGGLTWTLYTAGLSPLGYLQSLVIDPSNPSTLLGAEQTGVARSTDGGVTWTVYGEGIHTLTIQGVTVDPTDADVLYVAARGMGVQKSVDGGLTWAPINTGVGAQAVERVLVDPVTPSNLYLLMSYGAGILRSTNGGATWVGGDDGIFDSVNALALVPSAPDTLYAATTHGVYKSIDGAVSWTPTPFPFTSDNGTAIAVHPSSAGGVFVGVGPTLHRSFDGGDTWDSVDVQLSLFGGTINALGIDPTDPLAMYALVSNGFLPGIYRSLDGGSSWSASQTTASPTQIAFGPGTPAMVVAVSQAGVFASRNQGGTWSNIIDGVAYPQAVAIGGSQLYVGANNSGLWRRSAISCLSDAECDDLNFCTTDVCNPGDPGASAVGCVHTPVTCTPSPCHSATCQYDSGLCLETPVADNTACADDGTICTRDVCKAGTCSHDPQLVTSCKQAPAKKSALAIKNLVPAKAALTWKWARGDATSLVEVGDPFNTGASDYTLCGFDRSGPGGSYALAFSIQAPAGGLCGTPPKACWTPKGVKVRYKDKDRTPSGADTFEIVPGDAGASKISMSAKGLNLSVPATALAPDVHLQLRRDDASTCWEAVFQTNVMKNLPGLFKAKSN